MKFRLRNTYLTLGLCSIASLALLMAPFADAANRIAPAVTVKDLQGKPARLTFRGKTRLVVFWATWCAPCLAEIPDLKRLHTRYRSQGFEVQAIAMDEGGMSAVRPFARERKLPYPVFIGNEATANAFGVTGIPVSLLIDSRGRLIKRYEGLQKPDALSREIMRHLPRGARKVRKAS